MKCGWMLFALQALEAERTAERISQHVDLGGQSASGAPQRLIFGAFAACGLLVGANNGAIDHQILVVTIGGQRGEYPLPDAGMASG
jgi:hypothetical protein